MFPQKRGGGSKPGGNYGPISRDDNESKDKYQTIKFGQLMGCNMRKIYLEKSYTKCGGETSPRPFPEKSNVKLF